MNQSKLAFFMQVQLYREEIDREVQKHQKDQTEKVINSALLELYCFTVVK